jgi:DNA-binding protein H-NS
MDKNLEKSLTALKLSDLTEVQTFIDKLIVNKKKTSKAANRKKLIEYAKKLGYSGVEELMSDGTTPSENPQRPQAKAKTEPPLMYVDSDNPENTWAGRSDNLLPKWARDKGLNRNQIKRSKKYQNPAYLAYKRKQDPKWTFPK